MKVGESKKITIEPKDAYGETNPTFLKIIKVGEGFMLPN
jgi:FKBP-type peptidyl-prolyl cis-trans isomerase 2